MFLKSELEEAFASGPCQEDLRALRQALVEARLKRTPSLRDESVTRLLYLVESVLASAPAWNPGDRSPVCQAAAEASELLALGADDPDMALKHRLRSALLYELARQPAMAAGVASAGAWSGTFGDFLSYRGLFGRAATDNSPTNGSIESPVIPLLDWDAARLAEYMMGRAPHPPVTNASALARLAVYLQLGFSSSECAAIHEVVGSRSQRSVRSNVSPRLFDSLRRQEFPIELFPSQVDAISLGLLDGSISGWGFAAPTGTGKSFIARLLIQDALSQRPGKSVVYLVPTRALVHEVTHSLRGFFAGSAIQIMAVTPQLISLDDREEQGLDEADVAVLTPEKADLLLRLGSKVLDRLQLVIVDEAHHLESGTRGALLELYLVRLCRIVRPRPRVVLLSAVAPNVLKLAAWVGGERTGGGTSPARATRMRPGVFRIKKEGRRNKGWIDYADGTSVRLLDERLESGRKLVAQVCDALTVAGPVLVVARGKRECENLSQALVTLRDDGRPVPALDEVGRDHFDRLDSRLEREMYGAVPMREYLRHGIAYHHAGLPPRVRLAVEDAIRGGVVDVVFATTTLAEGVNFPFSSVLVQSLALRDAPERGRPARYHPVTPRSFWNIAGRAGRPGIDHEGQAILFEPSLGLDKVGAVLGPYLNPELMALDPVQSALGRAIVGIQQDLEDGRVELADLRQPVLSGALPRSTLGAVNLVRIALVHGSTAADRLSTEGIVTRTLAYSQGGQDERRFLVTLFAGQRAVLDEFFAQPGAPDPMTVAELGLSIDTLTQLRSYASSLADWQIESFQRAMRGGNANLNQAIYTLSPVAKRMSELEGRALGGLFGNVALLWLSGVPLQEVRQRATSNWNRLEELISVIYSRIQFLLPWGLYAFDRIIEQEASRRNIAYDGQIKSLAYLTDAGVPTFDALRLVDLGFERVDSTRLAAAFRRAGGTDTGTDIVGWLTTTPVDRLANAVRGRDQRQLDYDFVNTIASL